VRIAVGIEYDGSRYRGWQRQAGAPSVQAEVERALAFVADHAVEATCAGRTDAGVHALAQVAHFDSSAGRSPRSWVLGANTRLPPDIAVLWAVPVDPGFHARYSALSRSYRYVIHNRLSRPALLRRRVCWVHEPLDHRTMHAAAQALVGEHDFSAFRAAECQSRTPLRRIEHIAVSRQGECVVLCVTANAFLHHMVRNIAGTLIAVGRGDRPAAWVREVLESRDRRAAGHTADAGGLYLAGVTYPADAGLPVAEPAAWAMIGPAPQGAHQ
jgi:tRNA pseudouridine38-40 synthase